MLHYLDRKASNEVLHDVDRQALHPWTMNVRVVSLDGHLVEFQRHLLGQGLPPLLMVLNDQEV